MTERQWDDLHYKFTFAFAAVSAVVMVGGLALVAVADRKMEQKAADRCARQGIDASHPSCTYTYRPFGN